jgi:hypothetical protein
MALIGKAAMILSFDIESAAIDEHDNWHNHEHLPERLSIPGFRRGSRWVALNGSPHYFVMYEVDDLATLASPRYLERLNNPTPWTARMMVHYRGMKRGFCRLTGSFGLGLGRVGLLLRMSPALGKEAQLREWLAEKLLPALPAQPGLSSAHLFEAAATPEETKEQRIRGKDCAVDWVVLVSGFNREQVASLADGELSRQQLEQHGAIDVAEGLYQMDYSLTDRELSQEK